MKGSSSARLPKINTGYLVAGHQTNKSVSKKKGTQKTNSNKANRNKPVSLSKGQVTSPRYGHTQPENGRPCINKFLEESAPAKCATLDTVSKQPADVRRHEPHNIEKCKLHPEASKTNLERRRLVSTKSRDRLLTLMPTHDTMEHMMNDDLFLQTRLEIDMMRKRLDNNRNMVREEISHQKSNCLLEQARKASRINQNLLGSRDRTNNCRRHNVYHKVFGARNNALRPHMGVFNYLGTIKATTMYSIQELPETELDDVSLNNRGCKDNDKFNDGIDNEEGCFDFYS